MKKGVPMKLLLMALFISSQLLAANVDMSKSSFTWKGTKVTGEHFGKISLKKAELKKAKDGKIKSGNFVMNMDTITIEDLNGEWAKKFVDHIKGPDFFNVPKFPEAKLVITGDDGKNLMGKLTIKGKTNKVTIPYEKKGNQYTGTMKFNRTKFDMKYGSGSFFKGLGDKMIHDDVTLKFTVALK
jgi:polyisoprenoid-binding protein YceI